jgi:AraC-like DNA-binding protein
MKELLLSTLIHLFPMAFLAIMALALLTKKAVKYKASVFLVCAYLSMACVMFYTWLFNTLNVTTPSFLVHFDFVFYYLSYPCLFIYVALSTGRSVPFRIRHMVHLLPVAPGLLYFLYNWGWSDTTTLKIIGSTSFTLAVLAVHMAGLVTIGYYLVCSYRMIVRYDKNIHAHHTLYVEQRQLYWLKTMFPLFILPSFILFLSVAEIHMSYGLDMTMNLLLFSLLVYLCIRQFHFTPLFYIGEEQKSTEHKYAHSILNSEQITKYSCKLEEMMQNKQLYLNPDLKIEMVAGEMGLSYHHLSQVINQKFGKKFPDFVCEYRIAYFMKLLDNPKNIRMKSAFIATQCGFKSREAFSISFKKITGRSLAGYMAAKRKEMG